jgi:hypothetical protein
MAEMGTEQTLKLTDCRCIKAFFSHGIGTGNQVIIRRILETLARGGDGERHPKDAAPCRCWAGGRGLGWPRGLTARHS